MCFSIPSKKSSGPYKKRGDWTDAFDSEYFGHADDNLIPGRKLNPAWDPENPYDYPKYYRDNSAFEARVTGVAGGGPPQPTGYPLQREGYQPVQGMPHHGGSRASAAAMGGRNNPYGASTAASSSRGGASRAPTADPRPNRNNPYGASRATSARSGRSAPPSYMSRRGAPAPSIHAPDGLPLNSRHRGGSSRHSTAHSQMPVSRFNPDVVRRRPSPPPLGRRR
ncbi:hypothetical protein MMC07_006740 [Pseudocyphellaria aurata]|nr:hypothetical protein [Pseudocyphellaria aurata]